MPYPISVKFQSPAQRKYIEAGAKLAGVSLSAFLRLSALEKTGELVASMEAASTDNRAAE